MLRRRVARSIIIVAAVTSVTTASESHAELPPPPPDDQVVVHLDGDKVVLEERTDETDWANEWTRVCESPCDQTLFLHHLYRVQGPGLRPSAPFRLQGEPGDVVNVHVTAAESANFYIGVTTTLAGGATTLVGVAGWFVSGLSDSLDNFFGDRPTRNTQTPWIATTGVGLAVLSAGLVIMLTNKKTHTSQSAPSLSASGGILSGRF